MTRTAPLLLVLFALACSSNSEEGAPSWTNAPASIEVYEGRAASIPFAASAADVRVEASGDGLEVEQQEGALLVRAAYGASPTSLHVELVRGGARSKQDIPVVAHRLAWSRVTWAAASGPPALEHSVFFVDEKANAAFLLHGSGYSPQWVPVDGAWRFDMAAGSWSPWTPSGDVPPPTAAARGATVLAKNFGYVYGGYTGTTATEETTNDLYRVDLATGAFKRLTSVGDARPRQLHAVVHDPNADRLIVFGGFTSTASSQQVLADTWTVSIAGDTATWTSVAGTGPSARYGSFYGFDAAASRFVVWSGGQNGTAKNPVNPAADAWALDLASEPPAWSKLAPTGEAPPGRRNGCSMFDPVGRRLFVFGGTSDGATNQPGLFVLDVVPGREAWTKLTLENEPPVRSSGFSFSLSDGRVACGFGNDDDIYADLNYLGY